MIISSEGCCWWLYPVVNWMFFFIESIHKCLKFLYSHEKVWNRHLKFLPSYALKMVNSNFTALVLICMPYGLNAVKYDFIRRLFTIFREYFDITPKLSKIIISDTFRIGYSLSQNVGDVTSAINTMKSDKYYSNYIQPSTSINWFNKTLCNVKDDNSMLSKVGYKSSVTVNEKKNL